MGLSSVSVAIAFLFIVPSVLSQVAEFVSIDCGGSSNYTDPRTGLGWVSDTEIMKLGKPVTVDSSDGSSMQYRRRRDFPTDNKKYCYRLSTKERRRYIARATFLYGSSGGEDAYPKFQLYLDATKWATVMIQEVSRVYVKELIIRAPSDSVDVCVCCAITGSPFISTLELRPLNLSMYATDYEDDFFLKVAARVNFGAPNMDALRYPDDPYDRIWESDIDRRPNYLVGVAPGTTRIKTSKSINTMTREYPPVKVMQTAVVGTQGVLSYRLNLEDFPANARAYAYFAEIEDLGPNETRKFKLAQPYFPDYSNAVVNIAENANGSYTLYEPSYMNVTLDFVLSFSFEKTKDSSRGPILNAIEISKYLQISEKTDRTDVTVLHAIRSLAPGSDWANEGGDPCIPVQWSWINCSSTSPPRVTKIVLSRKNLRGEIPPEINNMEALTELRAVLTGILPDMSNLINLKIVHLENNQLNGSLPSYLSHLPNLQELFIENNSFSGTIPPALLKGRVEFRYENNPQLQKETQRKHLRLILGILITVIVIILLLVVGSLVLFCYLRKMRTGDKGDSSENKTKCSVAYLSVRGGHLLDEGVAYFISLPLLEEATNNFSKRVGKGSFGSVYHGKMKDGKEIAVKITADPSSHLNRQFVTEVALLSRIHHRNLVPLIGYCEESDRRLLVYEYMHNGTLRDHLHGSGDYKPLDWLTRLQIAEDAAKGLEYLHTGCNPSIIHRDVKSSNILLDINMRAKVSDFGLSRQAEEDLTHVSSVARGTVGYLDPEYYASQQLTEKSDVYSFGVVLFELISGKKPISVEDFGPELNIVHWARSLIRKGDVWSIIDQHLVGNVKIESVWRIAEVANQCVEQRGSCRPRMQEVIMAIQDAIRIERGGDGGKSSSSSSSSKAKSSSRKTLLTSFLEMESPDISKHSLVPAAR
ncbi:PREDICTED: probable LRR receptor-like serine/threonine-protein kinase At1g67720 [Tarenaya hassleriana]|uniref:probable LRR receptor-like serine/threonine-protein kinase At1g67720 n=1 Tax=Tarenaya hassleriana TaxID=28532 RepID=UPI00053C9553|nr:PREDICTED: probable LRR receptor-like serine/threonine-protein kinase At1g67720 [Tarenaya hassleriana]